MRVGPKINVSVDLYLGLPCPSATTAPQRTRRFRRDCGVGVGRLARRQHHHQPAVRAGPAVRRQVGRGEHDRDARPAAIGQVVRPARARLHGEL